MHTHSDWVILSPRHPAALHTCALTRMHTAVRACLPASKPIPAGHLILQLPRLPIALLPPCPHVLQDLRMLPLADACRATAARCPNFSDAAALLRVWARQQQLTTGADGLSGCLLTLLLMHAVESSQAVSYAHSWQWRHATLA